MKGIITFLFVVCCVHARSQTIEEAAALCHQRRFMEAMDMAKKLTTNKATEADAYQIIGRIFAAEARYDSVIPYLEKAITLDKDKTIISGWSYTYLGQAHYMTGKKQTGIDELNKAIKLNMSKNSVETAKHILSTLPPDPKKPTKNLSNR